MILGEKEERRGEPLDPIPSGELSMNRMCWLSEMRNRKMYMVLGVAA